MSAMKVYLGPMIYNAEDGLLACGLCSVQVAWALG